MRWIVSQIGSRQQYAVPRAFARSRALRRLYTDAWWPLTTTLKMGPSSLRAFSARRHAEIDSRLVRSLTLSRAMQQLRPRAARKADRYLQYLSDGARFDRWVVRDLEALDHDPGADAFFAFNTGCLESLQFMTGKGLPAVLDQIDPARVEEQIVREEAGRWPGWQRLGPEVPSAYWHRLEQEWRAASIVLVNSPWTADALERQGVSADKMIVVPQALEARPLSRQDPERASGPLIVLWVGRVDLRKGIPYLLQAARMLETSPIRFIVVGPIDIEPSVVTSAPSNVEFSGGVPVAEVGDWYRRADVLLFPTLSDGFGRVQLEAMAHGVPVITTRRCGQVVEHERDGLLIEAQSGDAIASALLDVLGDREWLREMSLNAVAKAAQFTLERFAATVEDEVARRRVA